MGPGGVVSSICGKLSSTEVQDPKCLRKTRLRTCSFAVPVDNQVGWRAERPVWQNQQIDTHLEQKKRNYKDYKKELKEMWNVLS